MKRIELKAVPNQIFIDKEDTLIGKVSYLAGWNDGVDSQLQADKDAIKAKWEEIAKYLYAQCVKWTGTNWYPYWNDTREEIRKDWYKEADQIIKLLEE